MTIFVDDLFVAEGLYHGQRKAHARYVGSKTGHKWCHMATDGPPEELDRMAVHIGLKLAWRDHDHYDLTPSKRYMAVVNGAVEIGPVEMMAITRYDGKGRKRPEWLETAVTSERLKRSTRDSSNTPHAPGDPQTVQGTLDL